MRIRLDIPLELYEIASAVGGRCCDGFENILIDHVVTDSREVERGDLFFALVGKHYDGHDYISDAHARGAISVSERTAEFSIGVRDTALALLRLASYYKSKLPHLKHTVAITGSVGKTTTKNFLREMLGRSVSVHATDGNLNNVIGVSLSILSAPRTTEALVLELGMNSRGEIEALSRAICPTLSLITSIGTAHIGRLGSREQIALAKAEIRHGMSSGHILCPFDEPLLHWLEGKRTFSLTDPRADYYMTATNIGTNACDLNFIAKDRAPLQIHPNVNGKHNLSCLLVAMSACVELGIPSDGIERGVRAVNSAHTRLKTIELNGLTLLDDSYNASLESVEAMLCYLARYSPPRGALLGDILELGAKTEQIHTLIGRAAARVGLEHLYLYGAYSPFIRMGAKLEGMDEKNIFLNNDTSRPDITAEHIRINHSSGETILFKASHDLQLSNIVKMLKKEDG